MPSRTRTDFAITKLLPPRSRRPLVLRQSLSALLAKGAERKLVLVSAPAGFGKTTLLAQYYDQMEAQGIRSCWLSLDPRDRDPSRYLLGVVRTLQTIDSALARTVSGLVEIRPGSDTDRLADTLVNDIAAAGREVMLFLDDYHEADGPDVSALMSRLLALAPDNLHVCIASRHVPSLNIAALRLHDECIEIGASLLRFSTGETREFMCALRGHDFDDEEIAQLHAHTEGWVAALQITALSLEKAGQHTPAPFTWPHREVADYLTSDLYDHLEPDIQSFLLCSSVLDQMTPALCNHILSREDSARILQNIERANLFLIPLDNEREWYRYHHLFRSFLHNELMRRDPHLAEQLCQRASDWFLERGIADEAIHYARRSGNLERVAELVEHFAGEHIRHGRIMRLVSFIRDLPPPVLQHRPWISLYLGYALFHLRRIDEVDAVLKQGMTALDRGRPDGTPYEAAERRDFEAKMEVIRIGVASVAPGDAQLIARARRILNEHPDLESTYLCTLFNIYGYLQIGSADHQAAIRTLHRARALNAQHDFVYGIVYADCFLGLSEAVRGRFQAALAFYMRAEELAAARSGLHSMGHDFARLLHGCTLLDQNRVAEARPLIETSALIARESGPVEIHVLANIAQARLAIIDGNVDAALMLLDHRAETMAPSSFAPARLALAARAIRLLIDLNRIEVAERIAADVGVALNGTYDLLTDQTEWDECLCLSAEIHCRLAMATGNASAAMPIVRAWRDFAARQGRRQRELELMILEIRTLATAGDAALARAQLLDAFHLVHPENYARPFMEDIPGLAVLMKDLVRHTPDSRGYVPDGLKASLPETPPPLPTTSHLMNRDQYFLLEALSDREREVLTHLAIGKSNQEIADAMQVAVNTVKWHVQNIFGKLGVSNRTAATLAAQHLGLI